MLTTESSWLELAKTQIKMGQYTEAANSLVKSINTKETYTACFLLGSILAKHRQYQEALDFYHRALKFGVRESVLFKNLGIVYQALNNIDKAIESFSTALEIDPNQAGLNQSFGNFLVNQEHNVKGIYYLEKELELGNRGPDILMSYGNALQKIGNSKDGAAFYHKGLEMRPFKEGYSHLLFIMHHNPDATNADFRAVAEECYNKCLAPIKTQTPRNYDFSDRLNQPNKKIRVGYISKRFRSGLADYWALAALKELDKSKFELVFYQDLLVEDYGTEEFKELADEWKVTNSLTNEAVADMVYEDKIDIFVDLVGHIGGGRLEVFTLKPAPIQVCWINYYGTLAMPEMDYFIADGNIVSEEAEKYFVEKVYKMPDVFNPFTPKIADVPITDTLPYKKNGYISFGSLNRFNKVNAAVLETWSQILIQVPNSRIFFYGLVFKEAEMCTLIKNFFQEKGIDPSRIITEDFPNLRDFFEKFNQTDILLDPFPFTGGSTTLDSILMGVPTITLSGKTWVHRSSSVVMKSINCEELIANDKEEYVSKYVELANDIPRLEEYRKVLRPKLLNSAFCDNKRYGINMQKAYEEMWSKFTNQTEYLKQS